MSNVRISKVQGSKVQLRLLLLALILPCGLLLALSRARPVGAAVVAATPHPPVPTATASVTAAGPLTATGSTTATVVTTVTTVTTATVVTTATAVLTETAAPAALDARAAAGRQIYLQNYCGICHTLAAAGTNGTFGPPHNGIATTARQRIADPAYTGQARTVVQYLRESIVEPTAYPAPGYAYTSHPMPSYAHLPKADLDALIYFLLQQK